MSTDPKLEAALTEAIEDEFRARAAYTAVLEKFGPNPTFEHIRDAETRHAAALAGQFERLGLEVPADRYAGHVAAPDSMAEACAAGIESEIANAEMYERLREGIDDPQVLKVFDNLHDASADNHLAAFEACAEGLETGLESLAASGRGNAAAQAASMSGAARGMQGGRGQSARAEAPVAVSAGIRTTAAPPPPLGQNLFALALGAAASAAFVLFVTKRMKR